MSRTSGQGPRRGLTGRGAGEQRVSWRRRIRDWRRVRRRVRGEVRRVEVIFSTRERVIGGGWWLCRGVVVVVVYEGEEEEGKTSEEEEEV